MDACVPTAVHDAVTQQAAHSPAQAVLTSLNTSQHNAVLHKREPQTHSPGAVLHISSASRTLRQPSSSASNCLNLAAKKARPAGVSSTTCIKSWEKTAQMEQRHDVSDNARQHTTWRCCGKVWQKPMQAML